MNSFVDSSRRAVALGLLTALVVAASGSFNPAAAADDVNIAGYRVWVIGAAFSPDNKTLATVGGQSLLYRPGEVRLWDAATGKCRAKLDGHESAVWSVAYSPDGKTLATGSYDGQVRLWDAASGKALQTVEAHKHWIPALAFSPDGKLLATGSEDATIKLWDISTTPPQEKQTLKGHTAGVTSLAFIKNDRLASGSRDKTAMVWSIPDGQSKIKFEGHGDAVMGVVALKDGKTLATAGADQQVKLWTLDEAKAAAHAAAQVEAAKKAAAAAEAAKKEAAAKEAEAKKAAEAKEAEAKKNEAAKKDEKKEPEKKEPEKKPEEKPAEPAAAPTPPPSPLELGSIKAHKNWITGLSLSSDGKLLATSSHDKTVKLWDIATKKEVGSFGGFGSSVWCAVFSADGKTLAAGSHGDSLKLWSVADKKELFPAAK